MQPSSSPRKAIHDIITNIRQIASNISKDVSMHPPIPFTSQPTQDQYPPPRPPTSNYLQDAVEIRAAMSTRPTVDFEESELGAQTPCDIAQGIKNAHSKVDQALRFMNEMKHKLGPEGSAKTNLKEAPYYERKCVSTNILPDSNKEDTTIKTTQLPFSSSLPVLSRPQETPSLSSLPMSYEELNSSPKNATAHYFTQHNSVGFNPFAKPVANNVSEMLNMHSNRANNNFMNSVSSNMTALNFNSSRSAGQSQMGSLPRRIPTGPSYMTPNNLTSAVNMDLQKRLLAGGSSLPCSVTTVQSGCDYNKLNQIIHNIKQKGSSQQQLSLNDVHFGTAHSLTSLHDQAIDLELLRPNTVSHFSKPSMAARGFNFTRENNFYQLPQTQYVQYEQVPSHFSSQMSHHERPNGFRPISSTFLQAVQKATNQVSEGETSENRYSENPENDEEFCKPRKLRFEKERVNPQLAHSRKKVVHVQEEVPVKQRKREAAQKQRKVQKQPPYQHKPHKVRDEQEVCEKRNNYRDVVHEDDCDSLVDESVVVVCHSRRHQESTCNHDSYGSGQSEEESVEESVRYERPRGKTITQRSAAEAKAPVCANCHCKKAVKQYVVYNTSTCSGRVSRSNQRSLSRRQKSSVDDHKVAFDESINTYDNEGRERQSQTMRRNKSIDCHRARDPTGRKISAIHKIVNNENSLTSETWGGPGSRKESKQETKVSLESLRRREENVGDYVKYQDRKLNVVRSGAKESQDPMYSKVFADQLALEFPSTKENSVAVGKNKAAQKTEIILSGNKMPRKMV